MIYYFSGTGNSKWAALRLAALLGDAAVNLMDPGRESPSAGEAVGLVFPIYAWGPPKPVAEFAKGLQGEAAFRYGVCTCGENAGNAMELLHKDFPMDSAYSLVMPNNYVLGSQLESDAIVREKLRRAKERLPEIAGEIRARKPCWQVEKGPQPRLPDQVHPSLFRPVRHQHPALFRHRRLHRLRPLRPELPSPRHYPGRQSPGMEGKLLPLHQLHQPLPRPGHPIRRENQGQGPVCLPGGIRRTQGA